MNGMSAVAVAAANTPCFPQLVLVWFSIFVTTHIQQHTSPLSLSSYRETNHGQNLWLCVVWTCPSEPVPKGADKRAAAIIQVQASSEEEIRENGKAKYGGGSGNLKLTQPLEPRVPAESENKKNIGIRLQILEKQFAHELFRAQKCDTKCQLFSV